MIPRMNAICEQSQSVLSDKTNVMIITTDDNICSSVHIRGSLDKREEWKNGIFENSRYFRFLIRPASRYYTDGDKVAVELISSGLRTKFRKYSGKPEAVIKKIADFLEQVKFVGN